MSISRRPSALLRWSSNLLSEAEFESIFSFRIPYGELSAAHRACVESRKLTFTAPAQALRRYKERMSAAAATTLTRQTMIGSPKQTPG